MNPGASQLIRIDCIVFRLTVIYIGPLFGECRQKLSNHRYIQSSSYEESNRAFVEGNFFLNLCNWRAMPDVHSIFTVHLYSNQMDKQSFCSIIEKPRRE